jgi:hypothetical protein
MRCCRQKKASSCACATFGFMYKASISSELPVRRHSIVRGCPLFGRVLPSSDRLELTQSCRSFNAKHPSQRRERKESHKFCFSRLVDGFLASYFVMYQTAKLDRAPVVKPMIVPSKRPRTLAFEFALASIRAKESSGTCNSVSAVTLSCSSRVTASRKASASFLLSWLRVAVQLRHPQLRPNPL